jgi:sialic acid synthase SpsE
MEDVLTAKGKATYGPASPQEKENTIFRPSIWVKKSMKKGEMFTLENICIRRPAHGLSPKLFHGLIGKTAKQDIEAVTPVTLDLIV